MSELGARHILMLKFRDLKLAAKMMIGFAATAIITLGVGWIGARDVSLDNAAIETLYKKHLEGVSDLKQAQIELLRSLSGQKNALVAYTPEQRDAHLNEMRAAEANFVQLMRRIGDGATLAEERDLNGEIDRGWLEFQKTNTLVAQKLANSEAEEAFKISNGPARETFDRTQAALE